jgi:hypothetical protein
LPRLTYVVFPWKIDQPSAQSAAEIHAENRRGNTNASDDTHLLAQIIHAYRRGHVRLGCAGGQSRELRREHNTNPETDREDIERFPETSPQAPSEKQKEIAATHAAERDH